MNTEKDDIQMSQDDNVKMSALEANIRQKGETAYYYAHSYKFDNKNSNEQGITITGPGIITGGDPVLLQKSKVNVEVIKENKKFTKLVFYDDDRNAVVKIEIPEEFVNLVTNECIDINFMERAIDLRVNIPNNEPYFWSNKKLFQKIVPEESTAKIVKGKVVLTLRKKNEDEEWNQLSA